MNFICNNCGGSVVFSPSKQKMLCPHCDALNSEKVSGDASLTNCACCGAELTLEQYTSATQCPYCDNYVVLDPRVTGDYKPDSILPFKISKKQAVAKIDQAFKKRTFAPMSFLSKKTLSEMQGRYVPFFLYDYHVDAHYSGVGTTVRRWTSGDYTYTETSYYEIMRSMEVDYDNIPADASKCMPDDTMDLMEPFEYSELADFDPKFMSGFYGEVYNDYGMAYEPRAKKKAMKSSEELMRQSVSGFGTLNPPISTSNYNVKRGRMDYTLLPVWVYQYEWAGKKYPIYVNGQTGKVVGKTPISVPKVLLYTFTFGALLCGIVYMALDFLMIFA